MLYWSHPELMIDAALHAAGDVDGDARRRQRGARDHRQPGVGGRDPQVPRRSPATGCTSCPLAADPRAGPGRRDRARRRTSCSWPAASGGRTRTGSGLIRGARPASSRTIRPAWSSPVAAATTRSQPVVDRDSAWASWVELRGWVDDDELPTCDRGRGRWCFPTLAEGFGLPVLEAMADGPARARLRPAGAARGRRRRGASGSTRSTGARSPQRCGRPRPTPSGCPRWPRPGLEQAAQFSLAARGRGDARGLPDRAHVAAGGTLSRLRRRQSPERRVPHAVRRRACACRARPAAGSDRAGATSSAAGPRVRPGASRGPASGRRRSRSSAARRRSGAREQAGRGRARRCGGGRRSTTSGRAPASRPRRPCRSTSARSWMIGRSVAEGVGRARPRCGRPATASRASRPGAGWSPAARRRRRSARRTRGRMRALDPVGERVDRARRLVDDPDAELDDRRVGERVVRGTTVATKSGSSRSSQPRNIIRSPVASSRHRS